MGSETVAGSFTIAPVHVMQPPLKNVTTHLAQATFTPTDTASYETVTTRITVTINKPTITIKANDKSAYIGGVAPVLGAQSYIVNGLANGETLKTLPTVYYSSTPDMSKVGTVDIIVSGAEAPDNGGESPANKNYDIVYQNGTLTINAKSSGGSGSGGTPPASNVIDTPAGSAGSTNALAEAVKNATATGKTNTTAYLTYTNYTTLTADGLKAINDAAAVTDRNVKLNTQLQLDNTAGGIVSSRITIDPAKLSAVMPDRLGLKVWFNQATDAEVIALNEKFNKHFKNKLITITFEQKTPLAVNMELALKLDLSELNTKSLYFYSYNPATNLYTRITTPIYWVDKNGYSHITAPFGGSIIITDSPLTKK